MVSQLQGDPASARAHIRAEAVQDSPGPGHLHLNPQGAGGRCGVSEVASGEIEPGLIDVRGRVGGPARDGDSGSTTVPLMCLSKAAHPCLPWNSSRQAGSTHGLQTHPGQGG